MNFHRLINRIRVKTIILLIASILISNIYNFDCNHIFAYNSDKISTYSILDYDFEKIVLNSMDKPVYSLPSPFTQPKYSPFVNDFFGANVDSVPIFSVDLKTDKSRPQNIMSFTFDSAYVNIYTYQILDILDKYDAKATFFMTYEYMKNNPNQIMDIIKRGHEIGNHSTTHPDLNLESDEKVISEVCKAHSYLQNLCGVSMCLFRFPYGSYSSRTVSILKKLGYYPIQWSKDSIDWKNEGVKQIVNRIATKSSLRPGNIILFHNGADFTPEALPIIFDKVNELGLKIVRVSDLIFKHEFAIAPGSGRQYYCGENDNGMDNTDEKDNKDIDIQSINNDEEKNS